MDRRAFIATAAACSAVSASAQVARAQPAGRFAGAIAYSAQRSGVGVIVVRHGIVLAEDYRAGAAERRWPIGAGTRCFAPLLAASLAQDGLMSLDEPVALTLGDWGAHPLKATITIRMLLSGASGIAFGRTSERNLAAAVALEPADPPGERFRDDAAPYVLLAEVARRKLEAAGRESDPAQYLTNRTLGPIGCTPVSWTRWPDGMPRFDDGAAVSTRGWAQAGELIRREGVWRAQQLADDGALREAVRGSFAEPRAGFGLWLAASGRHNDDAGFDTDLWRSRSPAPPDLAMAAGAGGQRLFFSASEGLVIARQSSTGDPRAPWSDADFLSLVWREL